MPPAPHEESPRSERDIRRALSTEAGAVALFDDLARRAKPWNGAAQLLRILGDLGDMSMRAREARYGGASESDAAMWVDGDLLVEIRPNKSGLEVEIVVRRVDESLRSVLAPLFFQIPFDELRWFIERVPELAGPLAVRATLTKVAMERLPEPPPPSADTVRELESTAERPAVTEQILDAMRPQFMTPVYIPPEDLLDKSR